MARSRMGKVILLVAGTPIVMGLFPGCLLPLVPLGARLAGNAVTDILLSLAR